VTFFNILFAEQIKINFTHIPEFRHVYSTYDRYVTIQKIMKRKENIKRRYTVIYSGCFTEKLLKYVKLFYYRYENKRRSYELVLDRVTALLYVVRVLYNFMRVLRITLLHMKMCVKNWSGQGSEGIQ
jgi:hypothetical protein